MTLRIEIQEQPERKRFWAEVEMGGMVARRKEVTSPKEEGLSGILGVVYAAAAEMDPRIMPLTRVPESDDDLDALRAEAEAAGVRIDRRWGEAKLREKIAAAGHREAAHDES